MTDKIKLPRIDANKIFINGVELNTNHIKNNSIVDGETITEALDSINSDTIESFNVGKSHTGWLESGIGTVNKNGNNFEFNINSPSVCYLNGVKYIIPSGTYSLNTNVEDIYGYIALNPTSKALYYAGTNPDFGTELLVGWYMKNALNELLWVADETHGVGLNAEHHRQQHLNVGAIWRQGGVLSINNVTKKVSLSSPIRIDDEDLKISIVHNASPIQNYEQNLENVDLPVIRYSNGGWTNGTSGIAGEAFSPSGAENTIAGTLGKYLCHIIVFTNDSNNPVKVLLSQAQYDTESDAIESVYDFAYLPAPEIVPAYKITFEVGNFQNTVASHKITTRQVSSSLNIGFSSDSHDTLIGKTLPDQHPISSITGLVSSLNSKFDKSSIVHGTGVSLTDVMSQDAVSEELASLESVKFNKSQVMQNTGTSTQNVMSQDATTTQLGLKFDKSSVKTSSGSSTTDVMSQKTVSDALDTKFDKSSVKQAIGSSTTDVMSQDAASKNFLIDANNTSQRKVFVQNGTPTGMNVGDIWIKI